jgi:hypothetical protein
MGIKIYDNFLPEEKFKKLQEVLVLNEFFPIYLHDKVAASDDEENNWNWYGTHSFYLHNQPVSDYYYDVKDLLLDKVMEITNSRSLLRMRLNFYPYFEHLREHKPHQDGDFPLLAGIYCLNTCDGFTRLEDGTKIDSIANRFYTFEAHKYHNSSTTTNAKGRFNINFNLI